MHSLAAVPDASIMQDPTSPLSMLSSGGSWAKSAYIACTYSVVALSMYGHARTLQLGQQMIHLNRCVSPPMLHRVTLRRAMYAHPGCTLCSPLRVAAELSKLGEQERSLNAKQAKYVMRIDCSTYSTHTSWRNFTQRCGRRRAQLSHRCTEIPRSEIYI